MARIFPALLAVFFALVPFELQQDKDLNGKAPSRHLAPSVADQTQFADTMSPSKRLQGSRTGRTDQKAL